MNTSSKLQSGLSLIELMVALAISSFLILGITQIYIDNKRSYVFQQSQAVNLEGTRFAALLLNDYLGKAGYRRAPGQMQEYAFPRREADDDCLAFNAGSIAAATKNDNGEIGICIRYQPVVSGEPDCQGDASAALAHDEAFAEAPGDNLIVLAIKYVPGDTLQQGALTCKSLNATTPQAVELLTGIADFRLDFGIGSNNVLEKEITKFIPHDDWTATTGAIRGVRYSILFASGENQRDSDDSKILDDWLANASDAEKERLEDDDNKRIYQTVSSTQLLRNQMP